ncbi:MAG: DUF2577 family protein [Clostridiales bacterium]|nr:DUF2577 family protein [Clostridiales bacterium]
MASSDTDSTSLKQLLQGMTGGEVEIYQGTVISASPLKIRMANDSALVITESNTYVPRHLTDYSTTVDISGGSVSGSTNSASDHTHSFSGTAASAGSHSHSVSGTTGEAGDDSHSHSYSGTTGEAGNHSHSVDGSVGSAGSHGHSIESITITGASMTVHNALKAGDTVHVLSLYNGKQYYVLDRVA